MSGGGGQQQGYQQQQATSSAQTGPPSAIEGALKNLAGQSFQYFLDNPNAPAYYPDSTVAPQSAYTQGAIKSLFDAGASGIAGTAPFTRNLTDTASGKFLDLSNNPYFQGAISYSQQPVIDAFNKQILPGITSTFEGAGRTPQAGNLAGNAVQTATDTLTRNLAGAATTAGANAYGQERANQNTAASLYPSLLGAAITGAGTMGQAGATQDAYQQSLLNDLIARYNYGQTAQPDYLTRVAQNLQAIYPGGASSGSNLSSGTFQQSMPQAGPWGAILGGAGLALQAAPLLGGLSDRRDKTDIELVGTDPLNGLPMYAYRYKSDPKSYPKIVGPMAQDIEKVHPDLVHEVGGHKVVRGLI